MVWGFVFSGYTFQRMLRPSAKTDKEAYRKGSHIYWRSEGLGSYECMKTMHRLSVDMQDPHQGLVVCWL